MQKYKESSRWRESRGCTRKRKYQDASSAADAARRNRMIQIYPCQYCGGWHITSKLQGDGVRV